MARPGHRRLVAVYVCDPPPVAITTSPGSLGVMGVTTRRVIPTTPSSLTLPMYLRK
jgi:hypothetical protein